MRELLSRLEVFQACTDEALDALAALAQVATLEAGEILFEEGDPATAGFVLARGRLRVTRRVLVEANRTLAVLRPGTFFGEAGVIDSAPRSATAVAEEESEIVALPTGPMQAWLQQFPEVGVAVLGHLARQMLARLRDANEFLAETVAWGVEVSGASMLGLDRLMGRRATVRVCLRSGRVVEGRLARLDRDERDLRLWVAGLDGEVHVVPYHAVDDLVADVDLKAIHRDEVLAASLLED